MKACRMKKTKIGAAAVILAAVVIGGYMAGTGFLQNPNVCLTGYSVSADGKEIVMEVGVTTSIGYVRGFRDAGGGVKPHYLTFLSAFGGLNGSIGARHEFILPLDESDAQIFFGRTGGGYELVLEKDEATGLWEKP